jgi:large subunit ribosomal protein L10
MSKYKAKIGGNKKEEVKSIQKLFKEYPLVGLVNLENLPALQYMRMKHKLKKNVVFKMSKKSVIKKAIEGLDMPNLDKFRDAMRGMPVLLFTKENPFSLAKTIKENKSNAAAKAGQTSPNDIVVPAGPTDFPAGPMIGEFGALGIKTEVKEGKIAIREDSLILKEGDVIDDKRAGLLAKLGIEPMEIGLNLLLTYEKGEIIPKEVLNVDSQDYINMIKQNFNESINLAVKIGFISKESVEITIKKLQLEAQAVASKVGIDMDKMIDIKEIEEKKPVDIPKEEPAKEEPAKEEPAKEDGIQEDLDEIEEEINEPVDVVDEVEEDAKDLVDEESIEEDEQESTEEDFAEDTKKEQDDSKEEVREVLHEEETKQMLEPVKEEPREETQQLPQPPKEKDGKIDPASFDLKRELQKANQKYDSDAFETMPDGRLVPKKQKERSVKEIAEEQKGNEEARKKAEEVAKKLLKGK